MSVNIIATYIADLSSSSFMSKILIVLHNIMALCKAKLNRNSLAVFLLDTACRSTMHMCTGIDQSLCLTPLVEHSTTHLLSNPAGTDKDSLVTSGKMKNGKMNHVLDIVSRSQTLSASGRESVQLPI